MVKRLFLTFYRKYIVYSAVPFVLTMLVGVTAFLYVTMETQIEIIDTYHGTLSGDRLIIEDLVLSKNGKYYLYKEKNTDILLVHAVDATYIDHSYTVVYLDTYYSEDKYDGMVNVDLVCGYTSLLNLILRIDTKYVIQ